MGTTEIRTNQVKNLSLLIEDLNDFGPEDGGGLNLNIKAGRIRNDNTITDKASQVVALTDNATNFVEIDTVGAATANTSAFTTGRIPIATVVTSGADITSISDKRAWVATRAAAVVTGLTDQTTITTDASAGTIFTVTLAGNRTLAAPTNPIDGMKRIWRFKQDATGSRTITLNAVFRLGTDITAVTLTTTASKTDYMGAAYNGTDAKWDVVAFIKGF